MFSATNPSVLGNKIAEASYSGTYSPLEAVAPTIKEFLKVTKDSVVLVTCN